MDAETRQKRIAELDDELERMEERVSQIREELWELRAQETPEERRRKLRVVGGGVGGIAAFVAIPRAWVRQHGRSATGHVMTAAGSAIVTAVAVSHPPAAPHGAPTIPLLPTVTPTVSITPSGGPTSHQRTRRIPLPPPVIVTTRRRTGGTSSAPQVRPDEVPLEPLLLSPSLSLSATTPPLAVPSLMPPSLLPSAITPSLRPSPTCTVVKVSADGRILICL